MNHSTAGGRIAMRSGGVPRSLISLTHFVDEGSQKVITLIVPPGSLRPFGVDRGLKLGELHSILLLNSNQRGGLLLDSDH